MLSKPYLKLLMAKIMRKLLDTLNTLTRLNQLEIDQLRLELAGLLDKQQKLNDRSINLGKQEDYERQWSVKHIDKAQTLPAFMQQIETYQQEIRVQLQSLQTEINETMTELQSRFHERKRFETVDKKQRLLNTQAENRLEQKTYDETANRRKVK